MNAQDIRLIIRSSSRSNTSSSPSWMNAAPSASFLFFRACDLRFLTPVGACSAASASESAETSESEPYRTWSYADCWPAWGRGAWFGTMRGQ